MARADHRTMTRFAQQLSEEVTPYQRPMPLTAPPVGPARARRLRLLQLREALAEPVDVDAVATAIVRRAQFTHELAGHLARETRDEGIPVRSEAV
jgi:hypothetical protein